MPGTVVSHRKITCCTAAKVVLLAILVSGASAIGAAEKGATAGPPRAALPAAELLKPAQAKVRDAHRKDFAKAKLPGDRLALAGRLLDEARAMKEPSLTCCATYALARDMAVELGNTELMVQAIDALAERFDVDGRTLKKQTLITAAMAPRTTSAAHGLAAACLEAMDAAATTGQYDEAMQYARAAYAAAGKAHDAALLKDVVERGRAVLALQHEAAEAQAARAVLAQTPDDRQANLTCGRYECLVKNDWSAGLPLLARGSDASWQRLAQQELAAPTAAAVQVELAQQWAQLAEGQNGPHRAALIEHAAVWYRKALVGLTGAEKTKIVQRLVELKGYGRAGGTGVSPVLHQSAGATAESPGGKSFPAPARQWVDVLKSVDPEKDLLAGKWQLKGEKLEATADNDTARLTIPLLPQGDYDLQIRFTRASHGALGIRLPIGSRECLVLIGYQGGANGLDIIDGRRADANASTFQGQLNNGRSYVLDIAVRIDGDEAAVTITLDDRPWIFYRGPTTSLAVNEQWKFGKPRSLGLVVQADVTFQSIRLRSLTGQVAAMR